MSEICDRLHEVVNELPRYYFPFERSEVYKNGIYILFEKNEFAHGGDRIVRVGTHTGDNNLYKRLKSHFINENKDGSIFRKNIGRAFLNRDKDAYLDIWNMRNSLLRKNGNNQLIADNMSNQMRLEKEVSKYIQENLSFVVIEVPDKDARLFYESKIISTVSLCSKCGASDHWLGQFSPNKKIVKSGLWLVNELYKEPFTTPELEDFIIQYIQ